MKISDRQLQQVCKALFVVFISYFIFLIMTDNSVSKITLVSGLALALLLLAQVYHLSPKFKSLSEIGQLINRSDHHLLIKSHLLSNESEIDIIRISQISIQDNYLGIILDGNGQGFDFHPEGTKEDIKKHLYELLTEHEAKHIKLNAV
ncbi:hypothetical protein ACFSJY_15265 [Thalassotalea euphylliae]|uniref:hypothetical protein n=1 Tax=Thalassotalea euphylliae TaxID=1655234 RepID=UPI00362B4F3D